MPAVCEEAGIEQLPARCAEASALHVLHFAVNLIDMAVRGLTEFEVILLIAGRSCEAEICAILFSLSCAFA